MLALWLSAWLGFPALPAAACPVAIGIRFDAAAPADKAVALAAGAYKALQQHSGTTLRLTSARIGAATTLFTQVRVPNPQAAEQFVAQAQQAGFRITAPPPHEVCGEPPPDAPATGHIETIGLCRATAPPDLLLFDAVFPRDPDTAGLSRPALAFRDRVTELDPHASTADADTMAPTFRDFLVHVRHQPAPPPTVRVTTGARGEAAKLAALAAAEGARAFVLAYDLSDAETVQRLVQTCQSAAQDEALAQAQALAAAIGLTLRRGSSPGPGFALGPVTSASGTPPRSPELQPGSPEAQAALAAPPDLVTIGVALPVTFGVAGSSSQGWARTVQSEAECRIDPLPPRPADFEAERLACLRQAASQAVAQSRALLTALGATPGSVLRVLGPRPELGLAHADRVPVTATQAIDSP